MKKVILTSILFFIVKIVSAANDSLTIENLNQRIFLLEAYKNEVLDKKIDLRTAELSNNIKYDLNKAKDDLDDQLWVFRIVGGGLGILFTIGVGAILYQYFVGFKKRIDTVLANKLDSHLSDSSSPLIELITSQRTENVIKNKKKLLILSSNSDESNATESLLKRMGFKNIRKKIVDELVDLEECDLIIFANCGKTFSIELIPKFLEHSNEEAIFIYFGGRDLDLLHKNDYSDKLNYANTKYTLYHQIVNTLSFKEIFKG